MSPLDVIEWLDARIEEERTKMARFQTANGFDSLAEQQVYRFRKDRINLLIELMEDIENVETENHEGQTRPILDRHLEDSTLDRDPQGYRHIDTYPFRGVNSESR